MDQGCLQIDRSAPTVYPRSDGFNSGRPRRRPMQLARRSFPPLIHGHSTRRVHACSPYIKHSTSPLSLALPLKISFIFHAHGLLSFIRPPRTSSGTYFPPPQAMPCAGPLAGPCMQQCTAGNKGMEDYLLDRELTDPMYRGKRMPGYRQVRLRFRSYSGWWIHGLVS